MFENSRSDESDKMSKSNEKRLSATRAHQANPIIGQVKL